MSYQDIRTELLTLKAKTLSPEEFFRARTLVGQLVRMGLSPRRCGLSLRQLGLSPKQQARARL